MSSDLAHGLAWQAEMCADRSPTYTAVIQDLQSRLRLTPDDPVVGALAADSDDPIRSALALRFLAAVQRVALRHGESPLHGLYETLGGQPQPQNAGEVVHRYATDHLDEVIAGMAATVQTNETGRAAVLSAGIAHAAAQTGVDKVRLLDVGASAGLNLWLDQYRIENPGGASWGPSESPMTLTGFWEEPPSRVSPFSVVERRGCDLNPLDLADPETALLLRSFVWPEDVERAARLTSALALAGPVPIDRSDATTWVESALASPQPGVLTVVMHSVTMIYFSDDEAAAFRQLLAEAGAAATPEAPVAHVSFEVSLDVPTMMDLTVTTWPGGESTVCARSSPHGTGAQWLAPN